MQQPSIFTRIIRGEIPAHKIYEDDASIAFLDIHPALPGHTLVVPKAQVDRLEDLPDADYAALMQAVKKVMAQMVKAYGPEYRACMRVVGFDVPHAHVHVLPCKDSNDFWTRERMDVTASDEELARTAKELAF